VQECVAGAGAGGEGGGHGHPHQAHQEQEAARHCRLHRGQVGHNSIKQCSRSGTCWYRSGSSDDLVPHPALFVSDLQNANKIFFLIFLLITVLFEGTFTSFFSDKKSKMSQNCRIQGVCYYFLLDD
jgi:hypothetical protein